MSHGHFSLIIQNYYVTLSDITFLFLSLLGNKLDQRVKQINAFPGASDDQVNRAVNLSLFKVGVSE